MPQHFIIFKLDYVTLVSIACLCFQSMSTVCKHTLEHINPILCTLHRGELVVDVGLVALKVSSPCSLLKCFLATVKLLLSTSIVESKKNIVFN